MYIYLATCCSIEQLNSSLEDLNIVAYENVVKLFLHGLMLNQGTVCSIMFNSVVIEGDNALVNSIVASVILPFACRPTADTISANLRDPAGT